MELSERIAELEAMKSGGQISQQEFEVLVSLAQTQNIKSAEQPPVLLEQNDSENAQTETKGSSSTFSTQFSTTSFVVILEAVFNFIDVSSIFDFAFDMTLLKTLLTDFKLFILK